MVAKGFQQITNLTSAVALTLPSNTSVAIVQAEGQTVRYRDDGVDPTTSVGMILIVGTVYKFDYQKLSAMKFIETTASAKLNVSYYGPSA